MIEHGRQWVIGTASLCIMFSTFAQPAFPTSPANGCELLPKEQVSQIVGGKIDSATPWPLAGKFACMYDGPAILGIDLLVKLDIGHGDSERLFDAAVQIDGGARRGKIVQGLGEKAIWNRTTTSISVGDNLDVLSGRYVVNVSFIGSTKGSPSEDVALAHAKAIATRVITNAKENGL